MQASESDLVDKIGDFHKIFIGEGDALIQNEADRGFPVLLHHVFILVPGCTGHPRNEEGL